MSEESVVELTVVGSIEDVNALKYLLSARNIECHHESLPTKGTFIPFTFESLSGLVVALGGGSIVTAVAKCIVTYLKERKRKLIIQTSTGGFEVMSENYTPDEIVRILASLPPTSVATIQDEKRR